MEYEELPAVVDLETDLGAEIHEGMAETDILTEKLGDEEATDKP